MKIALPLVIFSLLSFITFGQWTTSTVTITPATIYSVAGYQSASQWNTVFPGGLGANYTYAAEWFSKCGTYQNAINDPNFCMRCGTNQNATNCPSYIMQTAPAVTETDLFANQKVGIGYALPTPLGGQLDVNGTIKAKGLILNGNISATSFTMATGAGVGKFLTSDVNGVASWVAIPSSVWVSGTGYTNLPSGIATIGTSSPATLINNLKLDVNGILLARAGLSIGNPANLTNVVFLNAVAGAFSITNADGNSLLNISTSGDISLPAKLAATGDATFSSKLNVTGATRIAGKLSVGSVDPVGFTDYQLAVDGRIYAKRITVPTAWADFVFDPSYALMDTDQLGKYIAKNKHLPGIPSGKEIEENGLDMGEMIQLQMQKIEELTIYMLQQQKVIEGLNSKIDAIDKSIK